MWIAVDRHYLTPLFNPGSIVAFAGDPDADPPTPLAGTLRRALRDSGYAGFLTWLDVATTGTLADLANSRADLALIALPHEQVAAALEIVGRVRCRAALVLSANLPATLCTGLHQIARRYGVNLLGPNSMGLQRPALHFNAGALGPLATKGPL
ncbi:MAG TPA: GNAT family N-acetyltransferase, partial [Rubrivivax sp.]|nr:GNAT family N-acetyltransferase [Rubrivivax sp.]